MSDLKKGCHLIVPDALCRTTASRLYVLLARAGGAQNGKIVDTIALDAGDALVLANVLLGGLMNQDSDVVDSKDCEGH